MLAFLLTLGAFLIGGIPATLGIWIGFLLQHLLKEE